MPLKALCFIETVCDLKLKLFFVNAKILSKSSIFLPVWLLNFIKDLKKTIWILFHAPISYVCHFMAIRDFKLE